MKIKFFILAFIVCKCFGVVVHTKPQNIKVGVIENFQHGWASAKYPDYYMNGMQIAVMDGHKKNINYQLKVFVYDASPANMLKQLDLLKKWNPDIIIGPRYSEEFLWLSSNIGLDTLTVSPYATSAEVYKLPNNFYTLGNPDVISANRIFSYVKQINSNKQNITMLTDIECKSCVTIKEQLEKKFTQDTNKLINIDFINKQISKNNINLSWIPKQTTSTIFILNCRGREAGILMPSIGDYLSRSNMVYIGGDGWGSSQVWSVAKINGQYTYNAYKIAYDFKKIKNITANQFVNDFNNEFSYVPDNISYLSYNALDSITEAINKYNCGISDVKINTLCSYQKAIKVNPQFHRPQIYNVYKMNPSNEQFMGEI